MASVRERLQADGSVKFAVLFRERATRKQTSHTYTSKVEAEQMAAVVEANGGDLRSAQRGWPPPSAEHHWSVTSVPVRRTSGWPPRCATATHGTTVFPDAERIVRGRHGRKS